MLFLLLCSCSLFYIGCEGKGSFVEKGKEVLTQKMSNYTDFVLPDYFYNYHMCNTIYIDMGTNTGVQLLKWFWITDFSASKVFMLFKQHTLNAEGGHLDHTCAIGFEPNPLHTDTLTTLSTYLGMLRKKNYIYTPVGVGANNDSFPFYLDNRPKPNPLGFYGAGFHDGKSKNHVEERNLGNVPNIDIAALITHIGEMSYKSNKKNKLPKIIIKCDIEGQEYKIIPELLKARHSNNRPAMCFVDIFMVEWHKKYASSNNPGYILNTKSVQSRVLKNANEYGKDVCKRTSVLTVDDEKYKSMNTVKFIKSKLETK